MLRDTFDPRSKTIVDRVRGCIALSMLLLISLLPIGLLVAPVVATGDPAQPAAGGTAYVTGPWNVTTIKEYHDCIIIVTGNITVEATGSLTLNNVTLKMNSSVSGIYRIWVKPGGAFKAYKGTLITSTNINNNFLFVVNRTGILDFDNVTLTHCGLYGVPEWDRSALFVESDNVVINNSILNNNGYGIVVWGANITLTNSTLNSNSGNGALFVDSRTSRIEHNNLSLNNIYGLSLFLCELDDIQYITATGNGFDGLATYKSNLTLRHINSFANQRIGILSQSANLTIYDSAFTGHEGFFDVYATGHNQTGMTGPGKLDLYNVVFASYHLHDRTQSLNVSYSANVSVKWYGGAPVAGAKVTVINNSGTGDGGIAYTGTTDGSGMVKGLMLKCLEDSMMNMWTHTPQTFKAEKDGLIGQAIVNISRPWVQANVTIDPYPPILNITSPSEGALFNTSSIRITGTASDFNGIDHVDVTSNGVNWSQATGNNSWSIDLVLADGLHSVKARAFDRLGVFSEATINFTVDTTAPLVLISSPATGVLTNRTNITVSGTAEVGANLSSGTEQIANTDGNFSFVADLLSEGANTIEVVARDPAGNLNTTSVIVMRDTVVPTINVSWPPPGFGTKDDIVSLSGRVVNAVNMSFRNRDIYHEINVFNNIFDHYIAVFEGRNDIEVKAWDLAGNTATLIVTVIKDTIEPSLVVVWPNVTTTNERHLTIGITTEPAANVTVNGLPAEDADGDGKITYIMDLQNGENTITVVSKDWMGNSNTTWKYIEADFVPPLLIVDKPTEGEVLKSRNVNIFGVASDDVGLKLVEARVDTLAWFNCDGGESWYKVLELEPGAHKLTVRAWDLVGNNMTVTINFSVLPGPIDMETPKVTITWPKNDLKIIEGPITFTGTATDDVAVKTVEWSQDGVNWHPCNGTAYWSLTVSLEVGTYQYYFRVTDGVGRTDVESVSFTVQKKGTGNKVDEGNWWMPWAILGLIIAIVCVAVYAIYMARRDSKAIEEEERIERRGARTYIDDDDEEIGSSEEE